MNEEFPEQLTSKIYNKGFRQPKYLTIPHSTRAVATKETISRTYKQIPFPPSRVIMQNDKFVEDVGRGDEKLNPVQSEKNISRKNVVANVKRFLSTQSANYDGVL